MSVWTDRQSLFDYVYRTAHREIMAKRRQWFERPDAGYQVLWWVPAGSRPTPAEGMARLDALRRDGPTPFAFTFKSVYPPGAEGGPSTDMAPDPYCVGWS